VSVNRKLLLADESITTRRVIELTFANENVDVIAVSDGEQAIRRIPVEKPDIVLADIGMPKRSGYEVAAFVKQHAELSHVPVVLLAGAFEPVDEARARHVRSDAILVKPFEPHQVVTRVRELLDAARDAGLGTRDSGRGARDSIGTRDAGSGTREPDHLSGLAAPGTRESRVQDSGSGIPDPESRPPDPETGPVSLDEYFDRLDAAFAARGASRLPPPPVAPPDDRSTGARVPTIEDVLGDASLRQPDATLPGRLAPPVAEPAETSSTLAPAPGPPEPPAPVRNPLAHAFSLLLAVEQGELDSGAITIGMVSPRVEITDELVDRITRQVLQRLAPGTARSLVSEIVSEIAERLVHEEIQRIKKA
jgi:DNA-binding response OmpR family regulator